MVGPVLSPVEALMVFSSHLLKKSSVNEAVKPEAVIPANWFRVLGDAQNKIRPPGALTHQWRSLTCIKDFPDRGCGQATLLMT